MIGKSLKSYIKFYSFECQLKFTFTFFVLIHSSNCIDPIYVTNQSVMCFHLCSPVVVMWPDLVVCLFFLYPLYDEAIERYMRQSKSELNKLESKVWVAMNVLT